MSEPNMAGCLAGPCEREQVSLGAPSPGPVADHELVCRAAFDPLHMPKGVLKAAMIRKSDLAKGELSIWRLPPDADAAAFKALANKISVPENNSLKSMYYVSAAEIRQLAEGLERTFSVIDDTDVDGKGGRDAQHAAIAPCRGLGVNPEDLDAPLIGVLQNKLYLVFRGGKAWPQEPAL